ncbi:MAG: hypothetical protein HPY82_23655 [Gammaproteobacteria bacterium]|nr:hypothetical protein [Gammaproteobacteria bacterium]
MISTICRGIKLGIVNDWRELVTKSEQEIGDLGPGHVIRPLYAAAATQYQGLTLDEVISEHTLWKYYYSFLPSQPQTVPPAAHWHSLYNHSRLLHPLRQVRYKHAKQWRWCFECALEDHKEYGISYWHIGNQVPGISNCYRHPTSLLLGACSSCGGQINDLSQRSVSIRTEKCCPVCQNDLEPPEQVPRHPFLDWVAIISNRLLSGARFNTDLARSLIFNKLDIDPDASRTVAGNKAFGRAHELIKSSLPADVINCLFQGHKRAEFKSNEIASPLNLRPLYNKKNFVHPLSWLAFSWIVLSDDNLLQDLIVE